MTLTGAVTLPRWDSSQSSDCPASSAAWHPKQDTVSARKCGGSINLLIIRQVSVWPSFGRVLTWVGTVHRHIQVIW
jgi:hypothetical protein